MTAKTFDLGDVPSVTTGRLVSARGVGGLYDVLGFLTGETLLTHQLPRAARVCGPVLLGRFPRLGAVEVPKNPDTHWPAWLERQRRLYGPSFVLTPLGPGEYEPKDPVSELLEVRAGNPAVVVVAAPEAGRAAETKG